MKIRNAPHLSLSQKVNFDDTDIGRPLTEPSVLDLSESLRLTEESEAPDFFLYFLMSIWISGELRWASFAEF